MLPRSISRKRFETIAGRNAQVAELSGGFESLQLSTRNRKHLNWKALGTKAVEDSLGDFVLEAADHSSPQSERR
jgi:hypothetical protein